MKTRQLFMLAFTAMLIVGCKNESKTSVETSEEEKDSISENSGTYAELSVKKGGTWEGREYQGGEFENVYTLTVPEEHTDHSWFIRYEGPGWENAQVGYRIYLDWRNAIDIFGKKVDTMVLKDVGQDGFDSYHQDADWGMDILKAGKSMGLGGFGRYMNDTVAHFNNVEKTMAKVENSDDRSSVIIDYEGWKTGDFTTDLTAELSIFPEDRFTKAKLTSSEEIDGLVTGIVKHESATIMKNEMENWAYLATYGAQTLVNENDKLGMAVFYNKNEVKDVVEGTDDHLIVFNPTTSGVNYYFLGAWEQETSPITSEEEFQKYLNEHLTTLENQGKLE